MPDEIKPQETSASVNIDNKPVTEKPVVKDPFARLANRLSGKEPVTTTEAKPEPEKKITEPVKAAVIDKKDDLKPETKKPDSEKEPEFDEIVYNKEKVKIPVTDRQTYLQKGYNYDKVKQTADSANAALQRIAKVEGFANVTEYLAELDKKEKAKMAEQIEEAIGDPDKIDEIVKNHPEVVKTKEERKKLDLERVRSDLSKDRFFKELETQFDELMEKNPTAAPELVYKVIRSDYLTPEKLMELIAKEKESVEKRLLADVQDKERRAAPQGGDTNEGKDTVTPSDFTKKIANVFGVSASKVAQRAHEKMKRS